ncbi:MAG: TonB-dependent receptor, partial [Eudoraea sp.]
VMDIIDYDTEIMDIFSRDVLKKITSGEGGWEKMLPEGISEIIKKEHLFMRTDDKLKEKA